MQQSHQPIHDACWLPGPQFFLWYISVALLFNLLLSTQKFLPLGVWNALEKDNSISLEQKSLDSEIEVFSASACPACFQSQSKSNGCGHLEKHWPWWPQAVPLSWHWNPQFRFSRLPFNGQWPLGRPCLKDSWTGHARSLTYLLSEKYLFASDLTPIESFEYLSAM